MLCQQVLLDCCDLSVLRQLTEIMPTDAAPQPEDSLHALMQRAIDALTDQGMLVSAPVGVSEMVHTPVDVSVMASAPVGVSV